MNTSAPVMQSATDAASAHIAEAIALLEQDARGTRQTARARQLLELAQAVLKPTDPVQEIV